MKPTIVQTSKPRQSSMKTSWVVRVQRGGRITLPKELMEHMGWKVGDTLLMRVTNDGGILLERVVRGK